MSASAEPRSAEGRAGLLSALLDVRDFRAWSWRRQRLGLLGLMAACWFALAVATLWPQLGTLLRMQQEGLELQRRLDDAQASATQWVADATERARQLAQSRRWARRFPERVDASQVLRMLQGLADRHQVQLQRLSLGPRAGDGLDTQAMRLQGHAPFHRWGRLLQDMLRSEPLLRVTELEAQAHGPRGMQVRVAMTVIAQAGPPVFGAEP